MPSIRVQAVTVLARAGVAAAAPGAEVPEVVVEEVAVDRTGRPSGSRFGTLVHAILAVVDLGADETAVAKAAEAQGRVVGATEHEVAAAATAVSATLAHPLLRRAARCTEPGALRREVPVLLKLDDGTLAERVVDLAFRELGGSPLWTVVDFKTDRELTGALAADDAQVRLYATAVSRATGEPARGVLLAV